MRPIDHVLVATDFSAGSEKTLAYAAALARRLTARLTALHVVPVYIPYSDWSGFASPVALDPSIRQRNLEALRELTTPPGSTLPLADAVVREGDASEEILAYAAERAVDLIVLGAPGHHAFERLFVGSVAVRVVRDAHCPTLVVPPGRALTSFSRVLCAVDLTDCSTETMDQAAEMARATGAHLVLLHVVREPLRHGYAVQSLSTDDEETARRSLDEAARQCLADLVARQAHSGLSIEVRIVFGDARREIEQFAGNADLVVVGIRARRTADRLFFGSTARHVLRAAIAPLLLVPHSRTADAHEKVMDQDAAFSG